MSSKKPVLGESGLPTAADNEWADYHETEDCLLPMWLLGRISVDWNYCEHQMGVLIWHYFDDIGKGIAVTGSLGNQSKADLLLNFVRQYERSKAVANRTEFAAKAFNRLRESRNILIHSHSVVPHESGKLAWTRAGSPIGRGHKSVLADVNDLHALHDEIIKLTKFMLQITYYQIARKKGGKRPKLPRIYALPNMLSALSAEDW